MNFRDFSAPERRKTRVRASHASLTLPESISNRLVVSSRRLGDSRNQKLQKCMIFAVPERGSARGLGERDQPVRSENPKRVTATTGRAHEEKLVGRQILFRKSLIDTKYLPQKKLWAEILSRRVFFCPINILDFRKIRNLPTRAQCVF